MTKRITALLIAIVVPITLIFSGCGQLSEAEYRERLNEGFEEYAAAVGEFETVRTDVGSSQEIMLEQTKATEICRRVEKALGAFSKMKPPERFSEKHKELLAAAELEKKFFEAQRKVLSARTPDELMQYSGEADAILNGVPAEKQFPVVIKKLLEEAVL